MRRSWNRPNLLLCSIRTRCWSDTGPSVTSKCNSVSCWSVLDSHSHPRINKRPRRNAASATGILTVCRQTGEAQFPLGSMNSSCFYRPKLHRYNVAEFVEMYTSSCTLDHLLPTADHDHAHWSILSMTFMARFRSILRLDGGAGIYCR